MPNFTNAELDAALLPENITQVPYPEHPDRCQAVNGGGQCINMAVTGGTNCLVHGGNKQIESLKNNNLKNYRAGVWQARINRFSESSQIKNLREEVGILRMLMEERLTFCNTPMDLLYQSGALSDLVMKVEKLVTSCHKLEGSLGQHMDKTALMGFAQQVIQVISINVTDADVVDNIANKLVNLLTEGEKHEDF